MSFGMMEPEEVVAGDEEVDKGAEAVDAPREAASASMLPRYARLNAVTGRSASQGPESC